MILPQKHIKLSESLFALAAYVLKFSKKPITVDRLWDKFQKLNNTPELPAYHEMDNLILAVEFLYTIGLIDMNDEGSLYAITKVIS
jgi:hypothetical protein